MTSPLYAALNSSFTQCDVAQLPTGTPLADTGILGIATLNDGTVRTGMNGGGFWSFSLPSVCPNPAIPTMTNLDPGGTNTSAPNGPILDLVVELDGTLRATVAYNHLATVNPTSGASIPITSSSLFALGLALDPATGDLYFSSSSDVYRVPQSGGTPALFGSTSVGTLDGLAWSCDGQMLVGAASGNNIVAWTRSGGSVTTPFSTTVGPGTGGGVGTDGIAFGLPGTSLANFVYTNNNDGSISEICVNAGSPSAALCPTAQAPSTRSPIATTSGLRGDFMTVDPNGNILASQLDRVTQVSPEPGGGKFVVPGGNACNNFQCAVASKPACAPPGIGPLANACDPNVCPQICSADPACASVREAAAALQCVPHISCGGLADAVIANSGQVFSNARTLVDSYQSSLGAYGGSNVGSSDTVRAGSTIVNNGGVIHGVRVPNSPAGLIPIPVPCSSPVTNLGNLNINGGQTVTLAAGAYQVSNLNINSGGILKVGGPVMIWVTGSINISGLANPGGIPKNLQILLTAGANFNLNGGGQLFGQVYGPSSTISLNGQVFGSVIGSSVTLNSGAAVHFDADSACPALECLAVQANTPNPVSTNFSLASTSPFRVEVSGEVVWGGCDPNTCPNGGSCDFSRVGDAQFHSDNCFTGADVNTGQTSTDPNSPTFSLFTFPIQLFMNGAALATTPFNPSHVYDVSVSGTNAPFMFNYSDLSCCYGDNSGALSVCIFQE